MSNEKEISTNQENSADQSISRDSSKSRYNATKHGLRGSRTVLPGESQEEYKALTDSLCSEFNPVGTYEHFLVKRIADKMWELERIEGLKSGVHANGEYRDVVENDLRLLSRYETSAERSMIRLRRELSKIQKERENVKSPVIPSEARNPLRSGDDRNDNLFIFGKDNGPHAEYRYSQGEVAVDNLEKVALRKARKNYCSGNGNISGFDRHMEKSAEARLALEVEERESDRRSMGQQSGHSQPVQKNGKPENRSDQAYSSQKGDIQRTSENKKINLDPLEELLKANFSPEEFAREKRKLERDPNYWRYRQTHPYRPSREE